MKPLHQHRQNVSSHFPVLRSSLFCSSCMQIWFCTFLYCFIKCNSVILQDSPYPKYLLICTSVLIALNITFPMFKYIQLCKMVKMFGVFFIYYWYLSLQKYFYINDTCNCSFIRRLIHFHVKISAAIFWSILDKTSLLLWSFSPN